MGIPLKKSRRAEFNGKPYRYMVRNALLRESEEDRVLVTIQEGGEKPGRVLQVSFPYGTQVTGALVEKVIERAISKGWAPSGRGAAFYLTDAYDLVV